MNERLKQLRNDLGMSQNEFSERILVGSSTLAMWELGSRKIKDIHISKICTEFNVNENWLRYGIGEMFVPNANDAIDEIGRRYNLDSASKALILTFLELNELERKVAIDIILKCTKNITEKLVK